MVTFNKSTSSLLGPMSSNKNAKTETQIFEKPSKLFEVLKFLQLLNFQILLDASDMHRTTDLQEGTILSAESQLKLNCIRLFSFLL